MSQYADGDVMASKRSVATGNDIPRVSNACAGCRFDPAQATGERDSGQGRGGACPVGVCGNWVLGMAVERKECRLWVATRPA